MPISDINPNHELLVDSLSSNNAITIGGFIDECYSLLATNHRFALEVFRSPMNHYEAIILNLLPSNRYELLRRADCYHVLDTFTGAVLSIQGHTIANNRDLLITMIAAYLKRCNHGV